MRCDHLTPVIFRASGSKFRVMVRASAREIPHATASRHQRRKIAKRAACCLLCASIVESRNARYSLQNRPTQPPHRFPPCRSLTDRASAHLCPDTLHNAHASPLYSSITTAPQIRPPQLHHRPKTLRSSRPSPTHSTTKSPIVLSSSPQPPANPNLHALQLLHTPAQQLLNLAPLSRFLALLCSLKSSSHHHHLSLPPLTPSSDPLHHL